jgi:uncharacterized repeat protein (TIGR01451 family)
MLVENCSKAPAHHVIVRDPLPANAKFVRATPEPNEKGKEVIWRLGTLEGGAKRDISLVLSPTGGDEIKNCARVQFEHGQCVATRLARPKLSLNKNGPSRAILYDALSYELALTNTGEAPLHNLLLTDVLPAGVEHESGKNRLSWIMGTLEPGQTRSVKYKVIAKSAGKLCNKAIATADGGFHKEMENCLEVTEARLGLKMTGPKQHYVNTPAQYRITVTNLGTAGLENVTLDNLLPPQTGLSTATLGYQTLGDRIRWLIGALPPGASKEFEIALQGQRIGEICNRATASADRGITQTAEVCTQLRGAPALSLEVRDIEDPIEVGASTAYEIVVQNQGMTTATHVSIAATVPDQMEILKASGPPEHRAGQRVIFDPVTLAAGEVIRYRIDVRARRPGEVRFKVELTADQLSGGAVTQEESTTIFSTLPTSLRKSQIRRI